MAILSVRLPDGTWLEIPSLVGKQGEKGNGIKSVIMNEDYTLTFTFDNGSSYTTPSIRGEKGATGEVDYSRLTEHNTSETAHNDIRLLITGLTDRLNALANSDDETLDQMAELVDYIKDNRELIEQVTTNKVNVADISVPSTFNK